MPFAGDVIETVGGVVSVIKVVEAVKSNGGKVVAVGVMVNRNPEDVNSDYLGVPFHALGVLKAEAFNADSCPLCKKEIPVNTKIGHGKKFLEEKRVI